MAAKSGLTPEKFWLTKVVLAAKSGSGCFNLQ